MKHFSKNRYLFHIFIKIINSLNNKKIGEGKNIYKQKYTCKNLKYVIKYFGVIPCSVSKTGP